jgi:hypothetical protein
MRDDDHWLRALAQADREAQAEDRQRFDERWDRLSRGELSAKEERELRALAETSEPAREAWEAFRPLGPDFQAGVVRAIRAQGLGPAADAVAAPPAKLLPFPWRAPRLAAWSSLAAAAVVVLAVLLHPAAPLPAYASLTISGGLHTIRGEESQAAGALAPGDRFQVILQPATRASGKGLEARLFLLRGGEKRPLEARSEILPESGAVKMESSIGRDLQPGTWTLWAVVGRRGKLPDDPRKKGDWVAMSKEIRLQSRSLPP